MVQARAAALPSLVLKPGREKPVRQRHPWIFSGAVASLPKGLPAGSIVDVRSSDGRFLARGYANPNSKLVARLLTWDEAEAIDLDFWRRRLTTASARRAPLLADTAKQTAARLVMAEADQLPGLIIDRYGDYLVVQALTAGMDAQLPHLVTALSELHSPRGIMERSDDATRDLEGLPKVARLLAGEEPPATGVAIRENGLSYRVDLMGGHKTGFYLDQRLNHALVGAMARDMRVLDAFSYTGGFTLPALAGGAQHVLSLDASAPALSRLRENVATNALDPDGQRSEILAGDAFQTLRELERSGRQFDLIILDPPKFAHNAGQVAKAARGYKDINLLATRMLAPGGILATFSCSGHISADLFQKIVFGAVLDAGRELQILRTLTQADDHPVLLSFPESFYLKGLLCRAIS